MPPRIAVVSNHFPTHEGSACGSAIYNTVLGLQELADVEVFCPVAVYPRFLVPKAGNRRIDVSYSPRGIHKIFYFEYPALPLITRPLNGYECARRLFPLIEKSAPDLILNYWLYPDGFAAVQVARRLGKPVVVCSRGSDLRRLRDPFTRWFVHRTVSNADYVLTVSSDLRDRAIQTGADPARTRSIPNAIDHHMFSHDPSGRPRALKQIPESHKVILFVGRLIPDKGILTLLEAFRTLAAEDPAVRLVCVGEGILRRAIEDFAHVWGLKDRIHLTGQCEVPVVAEWMNCADVLCLPSYSEGCPNVVLESIACGCPVVATRVGGIPELVTSGNGIMVPVGDSVRLTRALREALSRQWDRAAIARLAVRGWDQVAAETYAVCKTVLGATCANRSALGLVSPYGLARH